MKKLFGFVALAFLLSSCAPAPAVVSPETVAVEEGVVEEGVVEETPKEVVEEAEPVEAEMDLSEFSVAEKLAMIDGLYSEEAFEYYQYNLDQVAAICPDLSEEYIGDIAVFSAQELQSEGQDYDNLWLLTNLPIAAAELVPGEFDCVELAAALLGLQVEIGQ